MSAPPPATTRSIAVVGCVAQAEGAEIVRRAPAVDLVIGPQSYHRLPELIARTRAENRALVETTFPEEEKFAHLPQRAPTRAVTAFLTVQEGCDKFCTFCVVPYTRGMEYSRGVADIEREARALVASGVREVTLLGQNVNGYHGAGPGRPHLLAGRSRSPSGAHRWARAAALHDQPSARHERRSHRRACQREEADAVSAPAVPVGRRSHPRRHEPQAHGARVPRPRRPRPRRAAGAGVVDRRHRRLPGRDGRGVREDARRCSPRSALPQPIRSSTARGPARRPRSSATRSRRR